LTIEPSGDPEYPPNPVTETPEPPQPTGLWGTVAITGNITSAPPGFSAVTFTDGSITQNFYSTTTDETGSTTLLPIIIGIDRNPIQIWKAPPDPNVVFQLPKIPDFVL